MNQLEALRCFCAIVETGGFRFAAERLHRTQPAVSQQLKALERRYGHPLIERQGCSPTPAGQLIYTRARQIIEDAASLDREIRDFDESAVPLRLGASDTSALYYLPRALSAFKRNNPAMQVALSTDSSAVVEGRILDGELDLGIVTFPALHEDLAARVLYTQRLGLVVSRSHELAKKRSVTLRDAVGMPFLKLDDATRTGAALAAHFEREGFTPETVLRSGSFEVIKQYVAEDLGIAILPDTVLRREDAKRLVFKRVAKLPAIRIGAVWNPRAYQPRAAVELLSLLSAPAE